MKRRGYEVFLWLGKQLCGDELEKRTLVLRLQLELGLISKREYINKIKRLL